MNELASLLEEAQVADAEGICSIFSLEIFVQRYSQDLITKKKAPVQSLAIEMFLMEE